MPQLASITINDGQGTPAAHTFSPVTTDGSVASLKERVGVPISYTGLTVQVRPPVKGGEVYKVRIAFAIPTTAVVDGQTVVDYTHSGSLELLLPERGTLQNRKDLQAFFKNALGHATVTSVIENLEPLY